VSRPQASSLPPGVRGALEYVVILALAVIAAVVAIVLLGHQVQHVLQNVVSTLQGP
jgi:hypothetical protein